MTSATNATNANAVKFQDLLRELFQFDCADLDFGIYRIMNHKRDAVDQFINENLPTAIAAELDRGPLAQYAQAQAKLGEIAQKVRANLGDDSIGDDGELADNFREVPVGKEYLDAQSRAVGSNRSRADVEEDIYNHLHTFFSRYYEDGDFISQRRYSGNQRYAIPYNGEEVYLHWANSDQYYVKTDEHFRNYDWQAPNGVTVRFRLKNAHVEQNNVKGDKRFFLPVAADAEWNADARAVTIPVEYRPLNKDEAKRYSNRDQQKKINEAASVAIPEQIGNASDALAALAGERHSNGNGPVSHLLYHLRRYSTRNNADYFIHKDLTGFLNQELDFYLKNEVLNLNNLAAAGQDAAEGWFQQLRLIKTVGGKIIDFLAQIEDFQKTLWEKRKFVTETQYCITLGNIDSDFYPDIISNEAQWTEWRELFDVDGTDRSSEFLKGHPTLVVDTKHFCADFTGHLLASFDDLDGKIDGLLVHSENWQALGLLTEAYRSKVKCIYIDPPFNTDSDDFLYKDGYQHSSWLAMMESQVRASKELLASDGTFYAHIDYNEKDNLKLMLDKHLHYITEIVWRIGWVSGYKSAANKFIRNHDTIYQYGKSDSPLFIKTYIPYPEGYTRRDGGVPTGRGYPLEDTWNCGEMDPLNSIQIISFSKEKVGNQALTQKNENLIARMLVSSSNPGDTVLDYFLGSGTTTAVAHKLGRQYIGIEIGRQFFEFALPRMKRVLYGDPYGISSEFEWKGGGMFKYIRLESYEDALDSIKFEPKNGELPSLESSDEYLLKYLLRWETRASETLLNVAKLANPFTYRLLVHVNGERTERAVDLPETFNYLLGLNVRTRRAYDDGERRYLVYRGETRANPGRTVTIIWRATEDWTEKDFVQDRDFVETQNLRDGADVVYVNGDSCIPDAKPIEPMFKERMFAGVNT